MTHSTVLYSLVIAMVSVPLAPNAGVAQQREPSLRAVDAADTKLHPFTDGAVYAVRTAPGRITDIALEPGETLGAVASGDTARWVIGDTTSGSGASTRAHVLVKPVAAGLSTNLVITTDRRVYRLDLTSHARDATVAVRWTYPQDEIIALRTEALAAPVLPVAPGVDLEQLRFDYAITGDRPGWRPVRAFDDGRRTFIEFPPTLGVDEAPPLFLVGPDGDAQLVNYRLSGRFYVVDRLFAIAELRLGTKRQTVVRITRTSETRSTRKQRARS